MATSTTNNNLNAFTAGQNLIKNFTENVSIKAMELQTGLSLSKQGILYKIRITVMPNENLYAAILYILIKGYDAIGMNFNYVGSDPCVITQDLYNWFVNSFIKENNLQEALKKTPAGSKEQLQDVGSQGSFLRYSAHNTINVMTGPSVNTPCLGADLLNSIHPGMVDGIENFCNVIRTHSYLSLPTDAFGGIQQAMWYITGAATALYQGIVEIYQGMVQMMQQVYAWLNNIYRTVWQYVLNVIEQIIPLSLICLILDAVQTILDDIGFFAQLFNGSDGLFNALNSIQTVVNYASFGVNFAYDPLNGLASLFPKEAKRVFDFIKMVENLPQAYLGKLVSHLGFGIASNNEGLAIANTIVQRFGLGSSLGPLNSALSSAGTVGNRSNWSRTGNTGLNIKASTNAYAYSINGISRNLPPLNINLSPFGWTGATVASYAPSSI